MREVLDVEFVVCVYCSYCFPYNDFMIIMVADDIFL